MSAKADAEQWTEIVKGLASERGLEYEPIGGINPKDGPVALCPGGTNTEGAWQLLSVRFLQAHAGR